MKQRKEEKIILNFYEINLKRFKQREIIKFMYCCLFY